MLTFSSLQFDNALLLISILNIRFQHAAIACRLFESGKCTVEQLLHDVSQSMEKDQVDVRMKQKWVPYFCYLA